MDYLYGMVYTARSNHASFHVTMASYQTISITIKNPPEYSGQKKRVLHFLTKDMSVSSSGYAGFKTKKALRGYLENQLFAGDTILPSLVPIEHDIHSIILTTAKKCSKKLPLPSLNIFVFPTANRWIIKKMGGISGYTPWKRTILLFMHPSAKWRILLTATLMHEYAHTASREHHAWKTLLDSLIFEGIAEHFRNAVTHLPSSPWIRAISKRDAPAYFNKILPLLKRSDNATYKKVFFGDKEFPLWTGYAIGYRMIEQFLLCRPNISWRQLITMKPEDITDEIKKMPLHTKGRRERRRIAGALTA